MKSENELALRRLEIGLARIKRGWTQGSFFRRKSGRPCYCAVGAAGESCRNRWNDIPGRSRAEDILESVVDAALVPWNDNPERKKSDVIKAYRKAIALAKAVRS